MFTKSHTDWIVNHNCFLGSTAEENTLLDVKMGLNNLIIFCINCFLISLVRYAVKMKTMQLDKQQQKNIIKTDSLSPGKAF